MLGPMPGPRLNEPTSLMSPFRLGTPKIQTTEVCRIGARSVVFGGAHLGASQAVAPLPARHKVPTQWLGAPSALQTSGTQRGEATKEHPVRISMGSHDRVAARENRGPGPPDEQRAIGFPHAVTIRVLLESDRLPAARRLLAVALSQAKNKADLGALEVVLAPAQVTRLPGVRDADRTPEFRAIATHAAEFRGRWVAVLDGGVVTSAPELKDLLAILKTLRLARAPLVHKVA